MLPDELIVAEGFAVIPLISHVRHAAELMEGVISEKLVLSVAVSK